MASRKPKCGRPSLFTEALAEEICARLADGESLRGICEDAKMPTTQTVRNWLLADEAFFGRYTRARECQADALFDDCLALADGKHPDGLTDPSARRTQIDTRKWMAGKLKGKYSDKVKHVGGDEDDAPIRTEGRSTLDVTGLSNDQLRALASIPVQPD